MRREVTITLVVEPMSHFQDDQQVLRAINGLFDPLRKAIGNAFATIGAPIVTGRATHVGDVHFSRAYMQFLDRTIQRGETRDLVRAVACPKCGAAPSEPCRRARHINAPARKGNHRERVKAAREATP